MSDIASSLFAEHPNGRIYSVVDVPGFPLDASGMPCECVTHDAEQRIEISSYVEGTAQRAALVAEAMGYPLTTGAVWRLVPVKGKILAEAESSAR